ncbi:unnamed protein product [Rotaria magnacalcarata]
MVNEEKSFPIEQSYINLAIVETKEQHEKEKKLKEQDQKAKEPEKQQGFSLEKQHGEILSTYEEIYGVKTSIDVENIFQQCKDQTKKVFILGRAGIGKSTFCQYVTYRWAKGELWSEYKLVILIRLRRLTDSRYPPGKRYSVNHLLENEYFPCDELSHEQIKHFKELCNKGQVLWILDGYDEFAQNIPEQLKDVFDHVRETQHHILTSRPYAIESSYDVKLEITGFTNDNIVKYVQQFFDQITKEINNDSSEIQKLLRLLKNNSSIWGVAHIPVNLELICSLWCNNDWKKTTVLTLTVLYDNIIEWQCRRYLTKKNINHEYITKSDVYDKCNAELQFLEYLAFKGMECNKIMLTPAILNEAKDDLKSVAVNIAQTLKMGILKSYDDTATGTQNQTEKQYYFVHLSFQEHFAARHLLNILKSINNNIAINFINNNKYNQRFHFVFAFAAGLLAQSHYKSCIDSFWSTFQGEPLDLVGIKHTKIVIACVDEFIGQTTHPQSRPIQRSISKWLEFCASHNTDAIRQHLIESLQQTNCLLNTTFIQSTFLKLLESKDPNKKRDVSRFISELQITEPIPRLQSNILAALADADSVVRRTACKTLGNFGEKAATNEVIAALVNVMRDDNYYVRSAAHAALGILGERATTNEVIVALLDALRDSASRVRWGACKALGNLCGRAATNEVILALLDAVRDDDGDVRCGACQALGKLSEKVATNEVIPVLLDAVHDGNSDVRWCAREALEKLGKKAATNEVIPVLLDALRDGDSDVRCGACEALGNLGDRAATNEVITALLDAMRDDNRNVRREACKTLGNLGDRAATNEVILALLDAARDDDRDVRWRAHEALGKLGEKATTNEVIAALLDALRDDNRNVRGEVCKAFRTLGEKAATNEVITALVNAVGDDNRNVRGEACKAFGTLGEKAATNEVITALVNAVGDDNDDVRCGACETLGKLGERAATNEVITALINAVGDDNRYVRLEACKALGNLGDRAARNEVITVLVNAVRDGNAVRFGYDNVRGRACETLGKLGERAATNEVIAALVNAMRDDDGDVRLGACKALGILGDRAATNEVITALVNGVGDANRNVRREACEALRKLGESATINEVITALVNAVGDDNDDVRRGACETLGNLGERAARNEVITALVNAVGDVNRNVRREACETLGKLGERAATNEVIAALLNAMRDGNADVRGDAYEALGNLGEKAATIEGFVALVNELSGTISDADHIYLNECLVRVMCSFDEMKQLKSETVEKLFYFIRNVTQFDLTPISLEHMSKVFLDSGIVRWLGLVAYVALLQGIAVTVKGSCIWIYDGKGSLEFNSDRPELLASLIEAFGNQKSAIECGWSSMQGSDN